MRRLLRLWRLAKSDLRLLWFALRHPERPGWLLPASAVLVFYALEPLNFAVPFVGVLDDFIILPMLLHSVLKFLPARIHSAFSRPVVS